MRFSHGGYHLALLRFVLGKPALERTPVVMILKLVCAISCALQASASSDFYTATPKSYCPGAALNWPISSRLECATACQTNPSCCGFHFNEATRSCSLSWNATGTPAGSAPGPCTFYMRDCSARICPAHFNETLPSAPGRFFYYGTEVTTVANLRSACTAKQGVPIEFYPIQVFNESKPGITRMLKNVGAIGKVTHGCKYYNQEKKYCHLPFHPTFMPNGSMYWPNANVLVTNSYYLSYSTANSVVFEYKRTTATSPSSYIAYDNATLSALEFAVSEWNNAADTINVLCECKGRGSAR